MICSDRTQFACDNLCGNPLPCGNHYCSYFCHALDIRSSSLDKRSESCEKCDLRCQKVSVIFCISPLTRSSLRSGLDCSWESVFTITCIVPIASDKHIFFFLINIFNSMKLLKALYWVSQLASLPYLSYHCTGENTTMPTSMSSAMPSWRLSTLQNSSKEIMSLWRDGACIRVHILQYNVGEGPNEGALMPWTLSQVTNTLVLYYCVSFFNLNNWWFPCGNSLVPKLYFYILVNNIIRKPHFWN